MTHSALFSSNSRWDGTGTPAKPAARRRPAARRGRRAAAVEALEDRTLFALAIAPYSPSTPAIQLANRLLLGTPGITITGASFVGAVGQAGNYGGFNMSSGQTTLAIPDGVILTTGLAIDALGPNDNGPPTVLRDQPAGSDDTETELFLPGDPDMDALLGEATNDAASLTINFTAASSVNSILFDFIFGSEEFPEFIGTRNDGFGVFLDGQQVTFDTDDDPISVNNNFFLLNNSGVTTLFDPDVAGTTGVTLDIEYDGLTPVVRTHAPLDDALTNHTIKFVIADADDFELDSGVFISRLQSSSQSIPEPVTSLPEVGRFTFSPLVVSRRETDLTATVTVTREGGASGLVTVDVTSANGTAVAGVDYTALLRTTLTFQDGQTSQTVSIPILNDTLAEGDESFFVDLSNPTNGAVLSTNPRGEVRIVDDELGVQFLQPVFTQQEAIEDNTATITVVLTGPAPSTVTVNFATTTGGSATADSDYTPVSGTLTFQPGVTEMNFQVPILDDYNEEPTETVNLALSTVSAPFSLGEFATAVLQITDLDRPPAVIDAQYVTNGRFADGVALRFSEPMDEALVEDLKNYDIFLRREKALGGSSSRTRVEVTSAVYEPTSRTVTLTTAKPLRDNKVIEVVASTTQVQGIRSILGEPLDGNFDNLAGDDFTGYLARGNRITYFDEEGDRVTLQLKGPGKLELFRDVERNTRHVRLISTSQDTILTGTVSPVLRGSISDKVAIIDTIFTGTGIREQLPRDKFVVDDILPGFARPGT
jgi:hypothetical protein